MLIRTCAGSPTSAMPNLGFLWAPAFIRSDWWWCFVVAGCVFLWWDVLWCDVVWCHVVGCEMRWSTAVGCEVTWGEVMCLVISCHVVWCDVMWCHVVSFHVVWCDVMRCHMMICGVLSSGGKWCDAMGRDGMGWDGLLCGCDAAWLGVKSGYVMPCGCAMWWIARCYREGTSQLRITKYYNVYYSVPPCATKYYTVQLRTTKYYSSYSKVPLRTTQYYSVLQSTTAYYYKVLVTTPFYTVLLVYCRTTK